MTTQIEPDGLRLHTERHGDVGEIEPQALLDAAGVLAAADQRARWRQGERLDTLFEDRCDRLRDEGAAQRIAVDGGGMRLTYDELDAHANRLARHLRNHEIRPGDRVALLFDDPLRSYVAILAVLKVHAAYVPLDPTFPSDRIGFIVDDANVSAVLSLHHLQHSLAEVRGPVLCLDTADAEVAALDGSRLTDIEKRAPTDQLAYADELAYIIYTSGSTGRPKGVAVEHSSICNFIRVAAEVYGYRPEDRVYQGMTIAFDFAIEEMWVPWMVGSTLVPKPGAASLLGAELGRYLVEHRVTALCCVPTLLATLDEELPDLRFLLVSGEACPRDLVVRWHRPGRRFLNVYGPTEATVSATWDVVHPDQPVTLGVPLPTYSVVILDPDEPKAVPPREYGEIGIAGSGLARGYVNRPDQTAAAFIPDFLGISDNPGGRIYRTGDLGRFTENGTIEYAGRIDTQVKIRGYRIELTEIESVVLETPGVAQAIVDTVAGVSTDLVAYYTVRPGVENVDDRTIHERLRRHLPEYMVPNYYERLAAVPVLPSGKADRKRLPPPTHRLGVAANRTCEPPATDTERVLAEELAAVLGLDQVSVDGHVFDDLGANSLLLAHFSARVRRRSDLPAVAMEDIYRHPTVRQLAATLTAAPPPAKAGPGGAQPEPTTERVRATTAQFVGCGVLQLLAFVGYAYLTVSVTLAGLRWASTAEGLLDVWLRFVAFSAAAFIALSAIPIALKWLLIGRWKASEIPVWTLAYVRFWFVRALINTNPLRLFVGTPVYVLYLRALGARIGRNVSIFTPTVPVCADLLTIGPETAIRKDTRFLCYRANDGVIQIGPVAIGSNVLIGEKSVLDIHTSMGDNSQLGHSSSLHAGQAVPDGARWHGSPAQPTDTDYRVVPPARCGTGRRVTYSVAVLVSRLVLVAPAGIAVLRQVLSQYLDMDHLDHSSPVFYADVAIVALVLYVGGLGVGLAVVATVPRVLNRMMIAGRGYPLYGMHYALHRSITRLTNLRRYVRLTGDSSLIVHYLGLIGYRQPNLVQTGSNFGPEVKHETPFAVIVGSGTMVSDGLSIVNADYSNTSFRISPVSIGAGNFFGNSVAYPSGGRTGNNVLVGTKTMIPIDGPVREHVGLLGSPPFEIPRSVERDRAFEHAAGSAALRNGLHKKNRHNAATLALFLASRWFLLFAGLLFASFAAATYEHGAVPVLAAMLGFMAFTITVSIVMERAALGFQRLVPRFCSIYDADFWRHERYWKFLYSPLPLFNGTPFKPMFWRLLGVRMGKRVFDDGLIMPEKTIVTVGDECTFNPRSIIQCHSMEDGAFKLDRVTVGSRVTLGVEAFVHYGVKMHDHSELEADSFLMKGTEVPANTRFAGNPAREIRPPSTPASH